MSTLRCDISNGEKKCLFKRGPTLTLAYRSNNNTVPRHGGDRTWNAPFIRKHGYPPTRPGSILRPR
jgi:hypothetical protein